MDVLRYSWNCLKIKMVLEYQKRGDSYAERKKEERNKQEQYQK